MKRIIFIRHGETDWNAEGRLQGQHDIPMNALGRRQAAAAALALAHEVGAQGLRACEWWASPLGRTRETMEIVRETLSLDVDGYRTDDRLKELSFGRWEGRTWREVRATDRSGAVARERDKWNTVPPGGESYEMLLARVQPFVEQRTRDSVIVSHGGVARVLMVLLGGTPKAEAPMIEVWQGKVLVFAEDSWRWL